MTKTNKKQLDTIESFIGQETTFNGNIYSDKAIRIDGKLVGNIEKCAGVIVGETANVKGNITASYVVVNGCVEGDVTANEAVELLDKSKVVGNIQTKILSISEGAIFEGKSSMLQAETKQGEQE